MSENFWNEFDKDNEKEVTERLINSETPEESAPQIDAAPADDVIEPVPQYIEAAADDVIESAPQYNEADADPQSDAADTAPQYDAAKDNGVDYSSFPYREPDPGPVQNRNIYSNSYASYQPAQPKHSYTERPSRDYRVDTQELPYNDGFYHKSFTQPKQEREEERRHFKGRYGSPADMLHPVLGCSGFRRQPPGDEDESGAV